MELFKMPRDMGMFEDKPVVIGIGRFGPYVLHDKKYVSIPKDLDPYTIPLEKAIELIQNKRIADANKVIKTFPENPDIQVLNGRFGPYIKAGKKNVKIPKDKEPASLTLEECVALAENAPEKRGRWGARAPKASTPEAKTVPLKVAAEPKEVKKAAAVKKRAVKKAAPKETAKTAKKKVAAKKVVKKAAPKKAAKKKK